MRRIALIRRRDGETVPFDPERVAGAIRRSLAAVGGDDEYLAGEIAAVVGLFLEKTFFDQIPDLEQVEDMVEKVLIETGHAAAAKAFILERERRDRLRAARPIPGDLVDPTLFGPRAIFVDDAAAGTSSVLGRESLARILASDGVVSRDEADAVAAAVEMRLRTAGVARAPASLVRSLAEAEVFDRVLALDLRRRAGAVLQPEAIADALSRRSSEGGAPLPARAARELGGAALRCHALCDVLPPEVAQAHMTGEIHVHGLTSPASIFSAALSPDDVKRGAAPGGGTRGAQEAAASSRRVVAALGRSVRFLDAAVTDRVALSTVPVGLAPLLLEADADEMAEVAWHLLYALSSDVDGRAVEIDLTPEVADTLADRRSLDGTGAELAVSNAELADIATEFAATVLRTLARGGGLPGRESLPVPVLTVSERTLSGDRSREVLRLAAEAVLRGERVVFPLARAGEVPSGTSSARVAPPDHRGAGEPAYCAGRITLNLPRAALRAGRGNLEGFLRLCDRLVELAAEGHAARRELLAQVGLRAGGSMAPLFRGGRGRQGIFDLPHAVWSVGITGLNEAVALLTGFEMHESQGDPQRVARRIVEYLALKSREATLRRDLRCSLDADEDLEVCARLCQADRAAEPEALEIAEGGAYTPGVRVRTGAPVDPLARVEREEALHRPLTTATLEIALPRAAVGGPDGLLALLRRLLREGSARQVEFRTW